MFFVGQRYLRALQPNIFGLGHHGTDGVAGRLLLVRERVRWRRKLKDQPGRKKPGDLSPGFLSDLIKDQRGGVVPVVLSVEPIVPPGDVPLPLVPPIVPPIVSVPVVLPAVPDVEEPDVVLPDVVPRPRPRAFDTLCGSVDVVEPLVLVGGFA